MILVFEYQQIAHLIVEHMHEEGIKIWNSQVPVQVSKINSGSLEVISQLNDGTTFANGFDTVLLAIGNVHFFHYDLVMMMLFDLLCLPNEKGHCQFFTLV